MYKQKKGGSRRGSNFRPNVKKPTTWAKKGGSGPPGPPPPPDPPMGVIWESHSAWFFSESRIYRFGIFRINWFDQHEKQIVTGCIPLTAI